MSTLNLNRVMSPGSVAVVGASPNTGSVGYAIMENMTQGGFKGDIFPVNPKHGNVMGIKAVPDVSDLADGIDMAVVATPISIVPDILRRCAAKGMGGAVIISAGNEISGEAEKDIEDQIKMISRETQMRIIGPNSVGIVNTGLGLNAGFMHRVPLKGRIAFVSEKGAVCTSVLDMAMRENMGFSHFVNLGSIQDVSFADMIDYFGSLNEVQSILIHMEGLTCMRSFMSAARAVSRVKPIIVLKSDRGCSGHSANESDDAVYDAAFRRAGILRVNEFEALFDCANFLAKQKRPRGHRLVIVSNAGGIGIMARDALAGHGLEPAEFSEDTIEKLEKVLENKWARTNPIDILNFGSHSEYIETVRICMNAPETDGLLLLSSPVGTYDAAMLAHRLTKLLENCPCPVFTSWMGGASIEKSREIFIKSGIVTYETPERAVRAFVNLYKYGRNLEILQEIPCRTDRRLEINREKARRIVRQGLLIKDGRLPAYLAKDLVASYGIPVGNVEHNPVPDYELTISAVNSENFGPVIRFGLGGTMTDVFQDSAIALPPLNRLLARSAMEETRIFRVFNGYMDIKPLDIELLEEILIRISRLVTDFPEIKSVDINPVQVRDGKITAADGRVILEPARTKSAGHLIISPYPYWQEKTLTLKDGQQIFVRPVRPSDADRMIGLFYDLSPETVYLRFFSPIKKISRSMLIKLTQIDYDREIALIAFAGPLKNRKIVGVARIIFDSDGRKGEFAIVLADEWQKKGLGAKLLHHALVCAFRYGLDQVWGPVITTNKGMMTLGKKLGFTIERDPESSEYKLAITPENLADI